MSMTTNKPGSVNQQPLYGCTSCYEYCTWPAGDLRVYDNKCWCDLCWDVRLGDFPGQPQWADLKPYTPVEQPECGCCGQTVTCDPDCDAVIFRKADQQPAPAVQGEPVGWQFYQDGKWWHGDDRIKDHRKNTEAAGYPIRDVYATPQPAPDVAALVEALERIAESCDTGRHDGLPEEGPALCATVSWGIAKDALATYRKQGGEL